MVLNAGPILPDTGVLGLVTHPSSKAEPVECKRWFEVRLQDRFKFHVPEISPITSFAENFYISIPGTRLSISTH